MLRRVATRIVSTSLRAISWVSVTPSPFFVCMLVALMRQMSSSSCTRHASSSFISSSGFSNGSSPSCTFTLFWMRIPICWMRFCKSFLILNASASFIVVSFFVRQKYTKLRFAKHVFFSPQCNKIHFFIHSIMNALLRKHKKCIFAPELVARQPPFYKHFEL